MISYYNIDLTQFIDGAREFQATNHKRSKFPGKLFLFSERKLVFHYFVFKAKTSKFFKVSDSGTKILAFTKSDSKWECIFTTSLLVSTCWKKI